MNRPVFSSLKLSYAQKIMLTASVILLFMAALLSAVFWRLSSQIFEQQENELLERSAYSMYNQLDTALNTTQNLTTQLVRSSSLSDLIWQDNASPDQIAAYGEHLQQAINTILSTASVNSAASIQFISVYLENGYICSSLSGAYPYENYDACVQAMQSCGTTNLDGFVPACWVGNITLYGHGNANCLVGMRFLYEPVTLDKVGVVVVGLRQSGLQQLFTSLMPESVLIRQDGTIIAASRQNIVGNRLEDAALLTSRSADSMITRTDGSRAFVYRLTSGPVWMVCPLDESQLNQNNVIIHYTKQVVLITLLAVALAMLLMWFSTKNLTSSLRRLKATVQRIYDGDLTARFQTNQHDEIAYLGLKINDMLEQVESFYLLQKQDAAEKQDLELKLMRAQINPHLLYNTLNSVLWIIRQNDVEKAEHLILSLGSFFRLALSKGKDEIPLSAEIAMLQHYLEIQNLGRGKSFRLHDEIDEKWKSTPILRLTLQTLVENAVIHGFSDWRDDGEITLSAQPVGTDNLCICITDNGIGILPEDLGTLTA